MFCLEVPRRVHLAGAPEFEEASKVNYLFEALGRTAQYQRIRISSPAGKVD